MIVGVGVNVRVGVEVGVHVASWVPVGVLVGVAPSQGVVASEIEVVAIAHAQMAASATSRPKPKIRRFMRVSFPCEHETAQSLVPVVLPAAGALGLSC